MARGDWTEQRRLLAGSARVVALRDAVVVHFEANDGHQVRPVTLTGAELPAGPFPTLAAVRAAVIDAALAKLGAEV